MKQKFKIGDRVVSKLGNGFWGILGRYGVISGFLEPSSSSCLCLIQFDGSPDQSVYYHANNLMAYEEFVYINDFQEKIREKIG